MRQKNMERKILCMLLGTALMLASISCSNSSPSSPTGEVTKEAPDTEPGAKGSGAASETGRPAVSEEQMQELYGFIRESVKTGYLDPAGILPESFQWPVYQVLPNGIIRDEGHAWSYFNTIALNYASYGTLYDIKGFLYQLPDEQICQLMNAVLDGMVEWYKLWGEGLSFQDVRDAVFPEYEKFPQNIDFSKV